MINQRESQLIGLVDASGAAGVNTGSRDLWHLVFHLVAWRDGNGRVERGNVRCEMATTKLELAAMMKLIGPYSTVSLVIQEMTPKGVAMLEKMDVLVIDNDALDVVRDELLTPVPLATPFGVLHLERRFGSYAGEIYWDGLKVSISLNCAEQQSPDTLVALADTLISASDDWTKRAKAFAADQLMSLKNDAWQDDDEDDISRHDFMSRMTLKEISIDENGDFTFYFDDGDLFWGHSINVCGNIVEGLRTAGI